ncbi:Uncharacterised protein [Enterobacter cloacae]|nr:Uncharacterised protein [Enterobacter cloacae]
MGELVNGIGVSDKVVNGHLRYGGVHQPDAVGAAGVARHVAHGCGYGNDAVGQGTDVRRRHAQLPRTVRLNRGLIRFTVQGHGYRLASFRGAGAA